MLHQIEKRLWSGVQSRLWNALVCSRQGPTTGRHNYLLWKNILFYMNRWGIKLPSTGIVLSLGHENIWSVSFKKEKQPHSSVSREALPWELYFYQENENQGMEHSNSHSIMYVIYSRGNHPIISQLGCDWHCLSHSMLYLVTKLQERYFALNCLCCWRHHSKHDHSIRTCWFEGPKFLLCSHLQQQKYKRILETRQHHKQRK